MSAVQRSRKEKPSWALFCDFDVRTGSVGPSASGREESETSPTLNSSCFRDGVQSNQAGFRRSSMRSRIADIRSVAIATDSS